jgi:hypothetical protein
MVPFRVNLAIYQGSTFTWSGIVKQGTVEAATPVDLSAYSGARMQIRRTVESKTVLAELTTENGGITLNAQPGEIKLFLADDTTAALTGTDAVYDLELTTASGDVFRRLEGDVLIHPEVTRA